MRFRYDIGPDESPSLALVRIVAELVGTGPMEMAPLGRLVNLDGLDQLLEDRGSERTTVAVRIELGEAVLTVDKSSIVIEGIDEDLRSTPVVEGGQP